MPFIFFTSKHVYSQLSNFFDFCFRNNRHSTSSSSIYALFGGVCRLVCKQKSKKLQGSQYQIFSPKIFQLFFSHSNFFLVRDENKRHSTSSSSGCDLFLRICLLFSFQKSKKLEHHQDLLISQCQNFDLFDEKKNFFTHSFNIRQLYHVSTSHKEVEKENRTVLSQKTKLFCRF